MTKTTSKLNADMQNAIDSLDLRSVDKSILEEILYLERINKNKEWSTDAVIHIRKLLNNTSLEDDDV